MNQSIDVRNFFCIFGVVCIVLGCIGSIVLAFAMGTDIHGERNGMLTLVVFLVGACASLFWGFLCFAIVQALDCLEGINYNLKKTSDNTQSIGEADQLEKDLSSGKRWKCPECGKIYMSYETSCMVCGISKPR